MSGIGLIISFVIAIVIMIVAISKFKLHPFIALMGISLILAIVVGIPLANIPNMIGAGFSGTFSSIGIVIILGALVGTMLEKTGGALKLAEMVVRLVGKKHPDIAVELMGWVVSIPVFCDSGFVILDPIRRALQKKTGYSSVALTVALSAGLYTSHVFIPPTPGPIAAASSLGVGDHLLLVMGIGAVVSIPCLIAAYFYAKYIGKRVKTSEDQNEVSQAEYEKLLKSFGKLPNGFMALAPIILPIIAMALGSISSMAGWTGPFATLCTFIGTPIIALAIGTVFGVILLAQRHQMKDFYSIVDETLKTIHAGACSSTCKGWNLLPIPRICNSQDSSGFIYCCTHNNSRYHGHDYRSRFNDEPSRTYNTNGWYTYGHGNCSWCNDCLPRK